MTCFVMSFRLFSHIESPVNRAHTFSIYRRGKKKKKAGYTRRNLSSESNQGYDDNIRAENVLCVQMHN